MSHVTDMNESDIQKVSMSHIAHMNESRHTNE